MRAAAWLLAAVCAGACPGALGQTYTSGSTTFQFIDSSTHTKVGHNTTPYKFTAATGCGTAPPVLDDTLSTLIPIGFSFRYGTTDHTSVYVQTNGRLQFGNTTCGSGTASAGPPQTYPYGYPNASMNATMKIFGVDLDPTNLVDKPNYPSSTRKTPCTSIASCYVSVATLGTAPSRQFVVTWHNVPEWVSASNTSGSFDLQIVLNEDGTFVYQYGEINHGGTGTAQIGWQLSTTDYQVLAFGAATEPEPNTAIKFYVPSPIATYGLDETAWALGLAAQVRDSSSGARHGTVLGSAQAVVDGKVCRAGHFPANETAQAVDAVRTGVDIGSAALNLLGRGSVAFWYRSSTPWSGTGARAAQLLDATAVDGQWFYLARTASGQLHFQVRDSTGTVRSVTTAAQSFAASTWVHIVATWDFNGAAGANQDSLRLIVNGGTPTASAFTSAGTVTTQVSVLHLGDNPGGFVGTNGTVGGAGGQIDEVLIFNYPLSQTQAASTMVLTRSCSTSVVHHLQIEHASGSGLTCTPATVTLRACANAACTTAYTGGVAGVLLATGSPTVNFDGSSGYGTGAAFVVPSGSSTVTKNLQVTTVGSVRLDAGGLSIASSAATTCNFGSPSCTFTAADSGFVLSVADHVAESSATLAVRAVRRSDSAAVCVPAFASVTRSVRLSCSYADPSSGTLPVRIAGSALNAAGAANSACDAGGRTLSLSFDASGEARPTLQYADVGRLDLAASLVPTGGLDTGLSMTGSTSFTARPQGLAVGAIACASTASGQCLVAAPGGNPGATSATGPAFLPAGRAFRATVTAVNAAGAATPNFGRESSPESVTLAATLAQPAGGVAGTLANGSLPGASFSAGAATVSTLSYSEVGIVTLTASVADGDYLGSGPVSGPASGPVGRFVPASFALTAPSVQHRAGLACSPASSFTHLGEAFRLGFTLTARNAAGATTRNYTGSFARLDPTQASSLRPAGLAGATVFSTGNGRLALGSASGSWNAGVASGIELTLQATRGSAPEGPFDAAFGVAPVDPDGVALAGHDLDTDSATAGAEHTRVGAVALRFGRLRLLSAAGAADRGLALPVRAEAWDGSAFAPNELDSCTQVPAAAVSLGNLRRTLTTADTVVGGPVVLDAGRGSLRLAAPAGGRSGTVDVALSLGGTATDASCLQPWTPGSGDAATVGADLSYLRGAWCGSDWTNDPSARASFGLPRGRVNTLYRRENY